MTPEECIVSLELPAAARVDLRVPKKQLTESGGFTPRDRRRLQDHVDELRWVAALKPANTGLAQYSDEERDYAEIVVLALQVRGVELDSSAGRRTQILIHRAIPYPLALIAADSRTTGLSLAHKRLARGGERHTVLEEEPALVCLPQSRAESELLAPFRDSLALSRLGARDLYALYDAWLVRLTALRAARLSGRFRLPRAPADAQAQRAALRVCDTLNARMLALRRRARSEKQVARQVALNLEFQRLRAEFEAAHRSL